MIYWIFGQTGSGKSTLSDALRQSFEVNGESVVQIDGDSMRGVWRDLSLNAADRAENNMRAARLAHVMQEQGHTVIVSMITPFRRTRRQIDALTSPQIRWIYLPGGHLTDADHPFETPTDEFRPSTPPMLAP